MGKFSERLKAHLLTIGWGPYDLVKWFEAQPPAERLSRDYVYKLCSGYHEPKDAKTLEKLSSIEGLNLSREQLNAWQKLSTASEKEKAFILEELLNEKKMRGLAEKLLKEKNKK